MRYEYQLLFSSQIDGIAMSIQTASNNGWEPYDILRMFIEPDGENVWYTQKIRKPIVAKEKKEVIK